MHVVMMMFPIIIFCVDWSVRSTKNLFERENENETSEKRKLSLHLHY